MIISTYTYLWITVSEAQGQPAVVDKNNGKGNGNIAAQPFNRLGWNIEMSGQAKSKQEEVSYLLFANIYIFLSVVNKNIIYLLHYYIF